MATSTSDMPLNGGHPALEFANTVDSRRGRWGPDLLRSYVDVIVLAQRTRLIDYAQACEFSEISSGDPRSAAAALKQAVNLREAIYAIFLAEDAGQSYPPGAFNIVHISARKARSRQVLTERNGGFRWVQSVTRLTDITGLFAEAAADMIVCRGERRPVRECKGDNCGWLFLDTSKGGRRRWCSDATCGAHARVKRFRQKLP